MATWSPKKLALTGAAVGAAVPFVMSNSHRQHVLEKVQYKHHGKPSNVKDKDIRNVKPSSAMMTGGLGAAAAAGTVPARDYLQGEKHILNTKNKYLRAAAVGLGVAGAGKIIQHEQLSRLARRTQEKKASENRYINKLAVMHEVLKEETRAMATAPKVNEKFFTRQKLRGC